MKLLNENTYISKNLNHYLKNNIKLSEGVFRVGSRSWIKLINEVRILAKNKSIDLCEDDKFIIESDMGKIGYYNNIKVLLDVPFFIHEHKGIKLFGIFINENNKVHLVEFTNRDMGSDIKNNIIIEGLKKDRNKKLLSENTTKKVIKENLNRKIAIYN
jgi:hypothetical protein